MRNTLGWTFTALTAMATPALAGRPNEPCIDPSGLSLDAEAPALARGGEPPASAPAGGSPALTDEELAKLAEQEARTEVTTVTGSLVYRRGIAREQVVMDSGGEITGAMRFITTDQPVLGNAPLRFSDLALLELSGRWAVMPWLELSGQVELLPKQPPDASEKVWQSAGLGVRTPLGDSAAVALDGAGGRLISRAGMWDRVSLSVLARKSLDRFAQLQLSGGVDALAVSAPRASRVVIGEAAVGLTALYRFVPDYWAAWIGVTYALPFASRGPDLATGMPVDPQPRLDFRAGTVLAVIDRWELFAEFAIIDRGDFAAPATRLPILDGGFDQRQIMLGITRAFAGKAPPRRKD
jgi:hypothetical protein